MKTVKIIVKSITVESKFIKMTFEEIIELL